MGNSPMLYVDPSGRWFFSAFLPGIGTVIDAALWSATWGAGIYTGVSVHNGNFSWGGFWKAAGIGAAGGALSAGELG